MFGALAVVIGLKLFFGDKPHQRTKIQVVPTWTDNRVNVATLNKAYHADQNDYLFNSAGVRSVTVKITF